uniref:Uncharacterized protein n=1 Tax=Oncorhynchus mykiss TaxID=8022 RepID=A0A8C7PVZ6_ONCMY
MRCLYRKKALSLVKELDAFPKVPESYVETTATGGTGEISLSILSYLRLNYYFFFIYSKLRINIDITVAMKCQRKCTVSFSPQPPGAKD